MPNLEHYIEWDAAYDRRNPNPSKDYGIHGVTCRWFVRGPEGAVQFVIYTNWMLPHVQAEQDKRVDDPRYLHLLCHPMAADLGYHSPTPQYESQTLMTEDCDVLHGPCYYDGSGLRAEEVLALLIEKGGEAVWSFMDEEYAELFLKETAAAP